MQQTSLSHLTFNMLNAHNFKKSHLQYIMRNQLYDHGKIKVVCVEFAKLICAFNLSKVKCVIGKPLSTFKMSNALYINRIRLLISYFKVALDNLLCRIRHYQCASRLLDYANIAETY